MNIETVNSVWRTHLIYAYCTCLLSRSEISFTCGSRTTQSKLSIEPFLNHLFVINFSGSLMFKSSRCSKLARRKCAEQSTEVLDAFHCAQWRWTKLVHFPRIKLSLGKRCMDTPSVFELFLQLTFPGPPATQYFPRDFPLGRLFGVSSIINYLRMNARVQPVTSQHHLGRAAGWDKNECQVVNFDRS